MTARRSAGFTLLEMLVTLVVVGMVVGVLWQALFQIAQVERRLDSAQLRNSAALVRVEWLRTALAGLLPGEAAGTERFMGSERELRGQSTAVPRFPATGFALLHLVIRFNNESGMSELVMLETSDEPLASTSSRLLLSWPGQQGRFRYQDARGEWQQRWPPQQPDSAVLPTLIVVETGVQDLEMIAVAPRGSSLEMPSRKVLEQM